MEKEKRKGRLFGGFRSVRSSMICSFAGLIIFALVTFLVISLNYTEDTVLDNSVAYTSQLIGQVNEDIDSYISYMENISMIVSINSDVNNFLFAEDAPEGAGEEGLRMPSGTGMVDFAGRQRLAEQVAVMFRTLIDTRQDITNIGIFLGNERYVLNRGWERVNPYVDVTQLSWYQEALEAEGEAVISTSHVQNVVYDSYDWVVTLSRRIRGLDETDPDSVFFVDLNYNSINSLCEKLYLGDKGYVFILDKDGGLIYHPQQQLLYSGLKTERISEVMVCGEKSFVTEDGYLYTISRSDYTGWTVVGVAYVPELLVHADETKNIYVLMAGVLLMVALFLAAILSDQITQPIKTLEKSMKEVEKGNFAHAVIRESQNNEIGRLSSSFNRMTEQIQNLMEETRKVQQAKRESELRVLQNQMNPHFLYNTLDSIIWMAEWGKNKEVVVMTSSLAKLLRQSISNDQELVRISEEVAYTESYLIIQKMRYRDKLEYRILVEEEILELTVIKLLLQPLVENSIYHGIKNKNGKGLIRILGYREAGCIYLQVQDDGVGMDEETLSHIFEKHVRDTRSNGVGLKNVKDRIALYYGPEYGLSYESAPGVGTTATIRLPDKGEEQKEHEKV